MALLVVIFPSLHGSGQQDSIVPYYLGILTIYIWPCGKVSYQVKESHLPHIYKGIRIIYKKVTVTNMGWMLSTDNTIYNYPFKHGRNITNHCTGTFSAEAAQKVR